MRKRQRYLRRLYSKRNRLEGMGRKDVRLTTRIKSAQLNTLRAIFRRRNPKTDIIAAITRIVQTETKSIRRIIKIKYRRRSKLII